MADIDYYENPDQWGTYQYTSFEEIINNYLANRDSDDFTSTVPRHKIIYQAKRGIRELYFDVTKDIKVIELDVSPSLNVALPQDYVNYIRISWIDKDGKLKPMVVDRSLPISKAYLQDHDYDILFDDKGSILEGSSLLVNNNSKNNGQKCYQFQPNRDNSLVYSNGTFSIDNSSGLIQFGSEIESKTIVVEYISDGISISESQIKIHKFAETALLDFIYYELIKQRRNVPANEKMRARKEFYNSRRIAKRRINKMSKEDFLQIFKGSSKWIK